MRDIGRVLTISEAARMVAQLLSDPSSAVYAEAAGWPYPVSLEALILLDQFDLTQMKMWGQAGGKGRTPKPHPLRPVSPEDQSTRHYGDTGGRPREEIVEILNRLGHTLVA